VEYVKLDLSAEIASMVSESIEDDPDWDVESIAWMLDKEPEAIRGWMTGENPISLYDLDRLGVLTGYQRGDLIENTITLMAQRCANETFDSLEEEWPEANLKGITEGITSHYKEIIRSHLMADYEDERSPLIKLTGEPDLPIRVVHPEAVRKIMKIMATPPEREHT